MFHLNYYIFVNQIIIFFKAYKSNNFKNKKQQLFFLTFDSKICFQDLLYPFFCTLNIFYCSKRQKDKTQVKQLRQSSFFCDYYRGYNCCGGKNLN